MNVAKGKPYDGSPSIARDSQWLGAEDLEKGRDQKVKVQAVMLYHNVELMGDKGPQSVKKNMITLKFANKERELIVNRTIAKVMQNMFGLKTGTWVGKEITLFVTQCQAWGKTVDCVRVRDAGSRPATAAEQFLHEDQGTGEVETTEPGHELGDAAEPPIDGEASPLFGAGAASRTQ